MKCEDIRLLLSDDELTSSAKEHISSCVECREFRRDIEVIMKNTKTYETTEEIDSKVLNFARNNRPVKKAPVPFYIWTAIAAAAVLILGVVIIKKVSTDPQDKERIAGKQEIIIKKDTSEEKIMKKQMIAKENLPPVIYNPQQEIDDLQMLLKDDLLDAELGALEGELFVLGSEFMD